MSGIFKYFTFYDKILIIFIVSISLFFIFAPWISKLNIFSESRSGDSDIEKVVIIKSKNKTLKKVNLEKSYQENPILIKIEGSIGISTVEIKKGRVRIKKAPAADPLKVCEKTGWISEPGPSIICVPNQISIWIEKNKKQNKNIDGVTW